MMKELALKVISELPDNVSIDDIIEALYLRLKIEKGLQDIEEGNIISHEQMKKEVEGW
ncbi:MAG: hypothetical protein HFJ28_02380 [Clostridia bacterium]|nr:hypothetical protein [Clostridia bacterium]